MDQKGSAPWGGLPEFQNNKGETDMETVRLSNGVEMPRLGFGTYQIRDLGECEACVTEAIEAGYRMIDTAQAYYNEEAVGAALSRCGLDRKELFVVTKVNFRNFAAGRCRESVLASMEKLRVEYLDLVLLHWPFNDYYAAWRDLEALYNEGLLRAIGVSNFHPDRLVDLINYNRVTPHVNQVEAHLFCQQREARGWMEKYGVVPMAYAPLGQARRKEMYTLPQVLGPAERYGKTPAQVMLRFLLQSGFLPIPKSVHPQRIRENLEVFDFSLDSGEMDALRALDTGVAMIGNPENPVRAEAAPHWK